MTWRFASGVLCNRHIPKRLKEKFHKVAIRSSMADGADANWKTTRAKNECGRDENLRWMCSKTGNARIRNERTRENLVVASSIGNKFRET